MMKTKWAVVIMMIAVLSASPAYAKDQLKPLTIQLNWMPTVQFAGVLLAKERGWYKAAGIDLTIKAYKWEMSVIDEVISGKAQIGLAEGDDLIKGKAKGSNIKAVAVQLQKSPFCLISKKDRGIEKPEQLIGKKVGVTDPASIIMTKLVLGSAGFAYKDIISVDVGWNIQPLIKNEIDVYVAFMNDEPLSIKEQGYEVNIIPAFKHGYDFYSGVYFVTDTMIQKRPEQIQAFLNVTMRGWREAFKNPHTAAEMIVAEYYPEGSVRQQTESLKIFHVLATVGVAVGDNMIGIMDKNYWQKGVAILHKFDQIDKKIPAKDLFTLKFVQNTFSAK